MKKAVYEINIKYIFDNNRKGAKYSIDGTHFFNSGELAEIMDKSVKGYKVAKDANTAYDKGSDIEETNTSVKSGKATLTSKVLGNSKDEILTNYFNTVHSDNWDWVVIIDDTITIYNMNKSEFNEFCQEWSSYDEGRKVVRFKATSGKMIKWLEERA